MHGSLQDVLLPVASMLELRPDDLILSSDTDEVPTTVALTKGAYTLWSTLSNRYVTEHDKFNEDRLIPTIYFSLDRYYYSLAHYKVCTCMLQSPPAQHPSQEARCRLPCALPQKRTTRRCWAFPDGLRS
jgi:hypothetical protein